MSHYLVVRTAFGAHQAGSMITDPAQVASVLASRSHRNVVRVFPEFTHVGMPKAATAMPAAIVAPAIASEPATVVQTVSDPA